MGAERLVSVKGTLEEVTGSESLYGEVSFGGFDFGFGEVDRETFLE